MRNGQDITGKVQLVFSVTLLTWAPVLPHCPQGWVMGVGWGTVFTQIQAHHLRLPE